MFCKSINSNDKINSLSTILFISHEIKMFKKIALSIISLCFFLLLFLDIQTIISERLIDALWPIGHVTVFAFWGSLFLLYQPTIKAASLKKQFLLMTVFCFIFGISIELIQPFFGRSRELADVFLNYVGLLLSIILFSRHFIHWCYKLIYYCLFSYLLSPSVLCIYDEIKAKVEYPVLASFEHDVALTRWKADQPLSLVIPEQLDKQLNRQLSQSSPSINKMMKVTFVPREYSGVALRYFEGDWQGYKTLVIRFYNPNTATPAEIKTDENVERTQLDTLPVTLLVTDEHYNKSKPNYKDRYEKKLHIEPGFSEISIPLNTIKDGVQLREMDLSKMAGVDFYMYELNGPINLYIDQLYLQ
ncbi:VanZ family protein [Psychromonas arctica]|uniref:VanZ family protein n=1 Tax=Psychromonas arctica TaxID=168275 RepID=A0ABU9H7S5_9GAMM